MCMKLMPAISLRNQICAYVNALSNIVTSTMTIAYVNARNNVNTSKYYNNGVEARTQTRRRRRMHLRQMQTCVKFNVSSIIAG